MYYTYVLKSKKDNKLYIGYTQDLDIRFKEHNDDLVFSTKNRKPFEIIYFEACLIKKDAIKREKQLKTGFERAYLNRRLSNLKQKHCSGIV